MNTGNSVADYHVERCTHCNGKGVVFANRWEFKDYLHRGFFKMKSGLDVYRHWKNTDEIGCEYCNGKGEVWF